MIKSERRFRQGSNLLVWPARQILGRMSEKKQEVIRFLWRLVRKYRSYVLLFLLFNLMVALFESGTMGLLALALQTVTATEQVSLSADYGVVGSLIDGWTVGWSQDGLFLLLIVMAVVSQFLRSGSELAADFTTAKLVSGIEGDTRRRLFQQFMRMSYAQVRRYKTGDLTSYNDQVVYLGATIITLGTILNQLFLIMAYTLVLLWLSWSLTLIALVTALLISLSLRYVMRHIRRVATRYTRASVRLTAHVVEFLHGLRVVHSFGREEYATSQVNETINSTVNTHRSVLQWQATISPFIDVMTVVGLASLLIGGYFLAGDNQLSVLVRLATFLLVLYRLMPRISIINKNWGKIVGRVPFVERISLMLRSDDKEYIQDGKLVFPGLKKAIVFDNVSLRYGEQDEYAVEDLSFEIPKGSMIALVGESGAGKSTTADLFLRLYDPIFGRIVVDGVDLRELSWQSWRDRLGVVSQESFIFHATIRENIAFGKLNATDEEIMTASQAAHAHEFILSMPDGYETVVGDQGYRLSGGQRQRIAIARAILRNPDILILDEATSSLDSQSEKLIQEALEQLRSERTVLAIAHRLSTIRMADKILVLNDGKLIETGTHEELLAADGRYAQLWHIQTGETHPTTPEV